MNTYKYEDIDWHSCGQKVITAENHPSNVMVLDVQQDNIVQGLRESLSTLYRRVADPKNNSVNAVVISGLSCLNVSVQDIKTDLILQHAKREWWWAGTDDPDVLGIVSTKNTQQLSEQFDKVMKRQSSGWFRYMLNRQACKANELLWANIQSGVMPLVKSMDQACPNHLRNVFMACKDGIGLLSDGFTPHIDGVIEHNCLEEFSVTGLWTAVGKSTIVFDDRDVIKHQIHNYAMSSEHISYSKVLPTLWSVPNEALLLQLNSDTVHATPLKKKAESVRRVAFLMDMNIKSKDLTL